MANWYDGLLEAALPSIVGSGLGLLGDYLTMDDATEAEKIRGQTLTANADAALEAAVPYGVGGAGGTADFDADSKTALLNLSPDLQAIFAGALGRSGMWGDQAMNLGADPFKAADAFYDQQQLRFDPIEERLRSDTESRLLAQGRLGSTGGMRQYQAVEDSILQGQGERRINSLNQAQQLINTLLGRESADIGTATGLLDIPMQYAKLGRGIGGDLGQAAQYGLKSRNDAASGLANVTGASPFGSALSGLGGLFTQPTSKDVPSIATQSWGQYFNKT
tara:strand:+ start:11321 stop:12151 length:831 start_codon:yes stop_codon:yes gene_type:complete